MKHSLFVGLLAAAVAVSASALADTPKVLGTYDSWTALTVGSGANRSCYIVAQPRSSLPAKAKRDSIGFLVTDWPGRKAKAEPQAVPGYPLKVGSTVTAQVGSDKFDFFTTNDNANGDGDAWIKSSADEARLVTAMRGGSQMIVTGISKRGTLTKDTYSLAGVSGALDKIHAECGM